MTLVWELIDIILSDVIDVVLALVVVGVALAAVGWPLIIGLVLTPLSQGKNRKIKSAIAFSLIFISINLTYFYYKSVPWSYSRNIGWRQIEIKSTKSSLDKDFYQLLTPKNYQGHNCQQEYSVILHHNLIITSALDVWYMKERMREWSDDKDRSIGALLKLLKVIFHFPGFVVKILVFLLWSLILSFYVYLSPYLVLTFTACVVFYDTRRLKIDNSDDDPMVNNNWNYFMAGLAGSIIPFWFFSYGFPERIHDESQATSGFISPKAEPRYSPISSSSPSTTTVDIGTPYEIIDNKKIYNHCSTTKNHYPDIDFDSCNETQRSRRIQINYFAGKDRKIVNPGFTPGAVSTTEAQCIRQKLSKVTLGKSIGPGTLTIHDIYMNCQYLSPERTKADVRSIGGNQAIDASRRWMNAVLKNDIETLKSFSGLPFNNAAFLNTSNNKPCPPLANDERTFLLLARCAFKDERYTDAMLSLGSSWKVVSLTEVERRFSELSPSGNQSNLNFFRSKKNIIIVEGRAKPFEGTVGIFLSIQINNKMPQIVSAISFGDIQVDSGSGE